jgi:hypothetical protein
MDEWKERYLVSLEPLVYEKVKGISRIKGVTIEEWVNENLRRAVKEAPEATEAMLQAIREPPVGDMPEVDIEQMLREIDAGYLSGDFC